MPPVSGYDPIATVQQAIATLLATQEPQFLGIGNRMFLSFAAILIAWHGIRMMLAWRESGEHMFTFARLLLFIAFGYAINRMEAGMFLIGPRATALMNAVFASL